MVGIPRSLIINTKVKSSSKDVNNKIIMRYRRRLLDKLGESEKKSEEKT